MVYMQGFFTIKGWDCMTDYDLALIVFTVLHFEID